MIPKSETAGEIEVLSTLSELQMEAFRLHELKPVQQVLLWLIECFNHNKHLHCLHH